MDILKMLGIDPETISGYAADFKRIAEKFDELVRAVERVETRIASIEAIVINASKITDEIADIAIETRNALIVDIEKDEFQSVLIECANPVPQAHNQRGDENAA